MRLYTAKIGPIASEIVRTLTDGNHIEVTSAAEVELDVQSVLKEYSRVDRELTEKAKDQMESRGLAYEHFGKIKRQLAGEQDFGLGEDALSWICTQLMETFMHSVNVDEVFADDATLRRIMKDVLRKHMAVDDAIDHEVRQRIKNMEEGTTAWEVEYKKVMDQIRMKHGLGKTE